MKIKNLIIIIYFSLLLNLNSLAENIEFESSNMDIKNNGNLIIAFDSIIELKKKKNSYKVKKSNLWKNKKYYYIWGWCVF